MFGWLRGRGRHRGRATPTPESLSTEDTVEISRILAGFTARHAVGERTEARNRASALTSTAPIARSLIQAALYPHGRHAIPRTARGRVS